MRTAAANPIVAFIERQGCLVLDGGMATTLEERGFDLDDDLWSARLLQENPGAIRRVHYDFLAAGADCIITASYQASYPGFRKKHLSDADGTGLLRLSVELALEARELFWRKEADRADRLRPLVAASIGPYGACLADGSEYTGRYGIDSDALHEFHKERWRILAASRADLLACETIPSREEAGVLLELLAESQGRWAWISFSCRDGKHLCDGSALADAARMCDAVEQVAAVGINCTSPDYISALIAEARTGTDKPIIVYPNSGEEYDAHSKSWSAAPVGVDWDSAPIEWKRRGAVGIGGCCRIGPERIAQVRRCLMR
jgi:homocysteine S-methyltransferase